MYNQDIENSASILRHYPKKCVSKLKITWAGFIN